MSKESRIEDQPAITGAQLAMLFFLISEAMLFASFFAAYFYSRNLSPSWPPSAGIERPGLVLASVNTVVLLASSLALYWATLGIRVGNLTRLKTGVLVALLVGAVFLAIEGWEYANLRFSPQEGVFGSTFYAISSLHSAHIIVGLILLAIVLNRSVRGLVSQQRHIAVEVIGYYWYFVTALWLVLFATVYVL